MFNVNYSVEEMEMIKAILGLEMVDNDTSYEDALATYLEIFDEDSL
ncbi:MAG: hypothetical protein ACRDD7_01420 [Peptostreptococcaceae bacterium]